MHCHCITFRSLGVMTGMAGRPRKLWGAQYSVLTVKPTCTFYAVQMRFLMGNGHISSGDWDAGGNFMSLQDLGDPDEKWPLKYWQSRQYMHSVSTRTLSISKSRGWHLFLWGERFKRFLIEGSRSLPWNLGSLHSGVLRVPCGDHGFKKSHVTFLLWVMAQNCKSHR